MLTLFAIPKPFHGHINTIQRNAIRSWTLLQPTCEIILFGNEAGIAETATEFKVSHIPDISRNEFGTPLLNDVFTQAARLAKYSVLVYVNADIIFMKDFANAIYQLLHYKKHFLMVGRRWNIDLTQGWDFTNPTWETVLAAYVNKHGTLFDPSGIDYFAFTKHPELISLPPFAVGRPAWDNWFIFHARQLRLPVIDATKVVKAIHQNHDYRHVPQRRGDNWFGPEGDRNLALLGSNKHRFTLRDATHLMTASGIWPALGYRYLRRRWQTLPILYPKVKPLVRRISQIRHKVATISIGASS